MGRGYRSSAKYNSWKFDDNTVAVFQFIGAVLLLGGIIGVAVILGGDDNEGYKNNNKRAQILKRPGRAKMAKMARNRSKSMNRRRR